MPKTEAEKKTLRQFKEKYGDRGEEVYFALRNKNKKFDRSQGGGYSSKSEFKNWWIERLLGLPESLQEDVVLQVAKAFPDLKIQKALQKAKTADYKPGRKVKKTLDFQGLPIAIEFNRGDYRHWTGEDGKPGITLMKEDYGYIKGTEGEDDMGVDTFVGPNKEAVDVFIIRQDKPDSGKKDEQKVMLGFNTEKEAKTCYKEHYPDDMYGGIEHVSMEHLREMIKENKKDPGWMDKAFSHKKHHEESASYHENAANDSKTEAEADRHLEMATYHRDKADKFKD